VRFDELSLALKPSEHFGGQSSLTNGLVSVWPLITDGHDAFGTYNLTPSASAPTYVAKGAGAPGNMPATVANFVAASSQTLSKSGLTFTDGVSVSYWAFPTADTRAVFGFYKTWANSVNIASYHTTSVFTSGGDGASSVNAGVTWTAGQWNHVVAWYDPADKKFRISANNETANLTGALAGTHSVGAADAQVNIGVALGGTLHYDGKLSGVTYWNRALTTVERTALYNGGAGLFY
jgi:hypothetical protein